MKKIIVLFVCALVVSCTKEVNVKGTKWRGIGDTKNIEFVFNDSDGFIIKHYSEIDRDTFYISYELKGDSVIINRKDDIVSMKESFAVTSETLKGGGMELKKEK